MAIAGFCVKLYLPSWPLAFAGMSYQGGNGGSDASEENEEVDIGSRHEAQRIDGRIGLTTLSTSRIISKRPDTLKGCFRVTTMTLLFCLASLCQQNFAPPYTECSHFAVSFCVAQRNTSIILVYHIHEEVVVRASRAYHKYALALSRCTYCWAQFSYFLFYNGGFISYSPFIYL